MHDRETRPDMDETVPGPARLDERSQATNASASRREDETFLSRQQLGARWGCSGSTIKRREAMGGLTPICLTARTVRYRLSEILKLENGH